MKTPFMINRLIAVEQQYAKRFTNMLQKKWGYLYWNEANKESYLCNHAIITDFIGVEASLKEISFFFKQKNIAPILFPSLQENELVQITPHLKNQGYELEMLNHAYYVHDKESTLPPYHGIYFNRMKEISEEFKDILKAEHEGEWAIKYLERHIKSPGYHLICGYVGDQIVAFASLGVFEGYSRIDDVYTLKFYRGKGYSGSLLQHLVQYNKENNDNHLYLYAHFPEAASLYEKTGFTQLPQLKTWRARKVIGQ